jgi:hypothetical protein
VADDGVEPRRDWRRHRARCRPPAFPNIAGNARRTLLQQERAGDTRDETETQSNVTPISVMRNAPREGQQRFGALRQDGRLHRNVVCACHPHDVAFHRLDALAAGLQTQSGDAHGDVERGTMRDIGGCLGRHGILRRWLARGSTVQSPGPVTDHPCRVSSLWAPPRHALRNSELGGLS